MIPSTLISVEKKKRVYVCLFVFFKRGHYAVVVFCLLVLNGHGNRKMKLRWERNQKLQKVSEQRETHRKKRPNVQCI